MEKRKDRSNSQWKILEKRNISVFWKYLCMNICLLLLSVTALVASNQYAVKELTRENLATAQISLEQNTERLANTLYQNYAIPNSVENTRFFGYFSDLTDDEPYAKYIPALTFLQNALQNQVTLYSVDLECLLYLPKTKNICGNNRIYPLATDCFEKGVFFEHIRSEEILTLLEKNHGIVFLPMQEVSIEGEIPQQFMTLIINPTDSTISIMTLYSEQMVLEYTGMASLPENTCLQLKDSSGSVIFEYPKSSSEMNRNGFYELTSSASNLLGINVTIWIPQSYFQELLRPSYEIGIMLVIVTILVGLFLSLLFSNVSVLPLRQLISSHSPEAETIRGSNEIQYLDQLIFTTRYEASGIRSMLTQSLMMRAFSGGILSDREELELNRIEQLKHGYRIALLHTAENHNLVVVNHLQKFNLNEVYCVMLNRREAGVLLLDNPEILGEFRNVVETIGGADVGDFPQLCCGISAPAQGLDNLHLAVRQARMIMPQNGGIEEYRSDRPAPSNISWLQHERMYQCIFANDEEQAMTLLDQIVKNASHHNAMEIFYNIRFVIRCAAEEVELELTRDQQPEFLPSLLPKENIRRLGLMLHQVFLLNQQKHETFADSIQNQIMEYLRENFCDDRLCAGVVSAQFDIPENRTYELVRSATGMSFNEYVLSLRMRKAATLLCSTQDGIRDIAAACGYPAESTFYRVFKKFHGVPPAQYRRGILPDESEN